MDVNGSDSRREVEIANRIIRDREAEHARELENVKKSQREQVDSLSANHSDSIKRVRTETNEELASARERFDKAIKENSDSFEKSLGEQRNDAYDKYGRLANDSARERSRAQEIKTQQIQSLIDSHEKQHMLATDEHKDTVSKLQKKFNEDRATIQKSYENKSDTNKDAISDAIREQTAASQSNSDLLIKRANSETVKTRNEGEDKYRKLADEAATERNGLSTSFMAREKQLNDDHTLNARQLAQTNEKTIEEHHNRASGALNETIHANNEMNLQVKRDNDAKLMMANQTAEIEKQKLRNDFRSAEGDLRTQIGIERDRNALKSTLDERRHRQENYLASTALADNSTLQNDEMKAHYSENLHDMDDRYRQQFEKHQAANSDKMFLHDADVNAQRLELKHEKDAALGKSFSERAREKSALIREYETRQKSLEDLHARQAVDSRGYISAEMKAIQDKTSKDIQMNNRENTIRVFEAKQALSNQSNELDMQHKLELSDANSRYTDKSKRAVDNYNRSLLGTKEAFDDETAEFKHEAQMQLITQRADSEHEKRMTLMDLLMRNRAQLAGYESKMNQTKDEHDSELAKMRTDNEKSMRETMRRARETLDTERLTHIRELEAKDIGTKEKLRMQEEAFKDTIEKMRRTHELSLKKS